MPGRELLLLGVEGQLRLGLEGLLESGDGKGDNDEAAVNCDIAAGGNKGGGGGGRDRSVASNSALASASSPDEGARCWTAHTQRPKSTTSASPQSMTTRSGVAAMSARLSGKMPSSAPFEPVLGSSHTSGSGSLPPKSYSVLSRPPKSCPSPRGQRVEQARQRR